MNAIDRQLAEDRALRDGALRLFKADLAAVRADVAARGVGARITDRVGDAALDTLDDAIEYVQDHPDQVKAGGAALALFLFRRPLLGILGAILGIGRRRHEESECDEAEPD